MEATKGGYQRPVRECQGTSLAASLRPHTVRTGLLTDGTYDHPANELDLKLMICTFDRRKKIASSTCRPLMPGHFPSSEPKAAHRSDRIAHGRHVRSPCK